MATGTSKLLGITLAVAGAVLVAVGVVVARGQDAASAGGARPIPPVQMMAAHAAPAGWHLVSLRGGTAVLAYPPAMRPVVGDHGAVSAAEFSSSGAYLLYLNSTPRQGAETLSDWPAFRVRHQREEDATTVRLLAASHGVRFLGGTGTCVIDSYVTRVHSNQYTEIACLVQGRTGASVIVAAAPTSGWTRASGLLMRAVAAYRVR